MNQLKTLLVIKEHIDKIEQIDQEIKQDKNIDPDFRGSLIQINNFAKNRAKQAIKTIGLEMFKEMNCD